MIFADDKSAKRCYIALQHWENIVLFIQENYDSTFVFSLQEFDGRRYGSEELQITNEIKQRLKYFKETVSTNKFKILFAVTLENISHAPFSSHISHESNTIKEPDLSYYKVVLGEHLIGDELQCLTDFHDL